jgi:hypothetical protein
MEEKRIVIDFRCLRIRSDNGKMENVEPFAGESPMPPLLPSPLGLVLPLPLRASHPHRRVSKDTKRGKIRGVGAVTISYSDIFQGYHRWSKDVSSITPIYE